MQPPTVNKACTTGNVQEKIIQNYLQNSRNIVIKMGNLITKMTTSSVPLNESTTSDAPNTEVNYGIKILVFLIRIRYFVPFTPFRIFSGSERRNTDSLRSNAIRIL